MTMPAPVKLSNPFQYGKQMFDPNEPSMQDMEDLIKNVNTFEVYTLIIENSQKNTLIIEMST